MRKLKLQVQMSLDGFIAGPNGEMDWLVWNWDEKLKQYVTALTEPVGTIVLGKNLAMGFIPHWKSAAESDDPENASAGKKFTETPKVVFSKTLEESQWENTKLAKGDLTEEITALKNEGSGDIIAYGGAQFVSSLIAANLIDEYHLFVNPTLLGDGMSIFKNIQEKINLKPLKATEFDCGITVLAYETVRD